MINIYLLYIKIRIYIKNKDGIIIQILKLKTSLSLIKAQHTYQWLKQFVKSVFSQQIIQKNGKEMTQIC